jgi:hypothetical protein
MVLKANMNDDSIVKTDLDLTIIARWLKIKPARQVELWCFKVNILNIAEYFLGGVRKLPSELKFMDVITCQKFYILMVRQSSSEYFLFNAVYLNLHKIDQELFLFFRRELSRNSISSSRDSFRFRFKTDRENGIFLYSKGSQGDYIALQLVESRVLVKA